MSLAAKLKEQFVPEFYSTEISTNGDLQLCLFRKSGSGRYCLVVAALEPDKDIEDQINKTRKLVQKYTKALWMFREVGVYMVFTAPSLNGVSEEQLVVDATGLHAVIIQGVHVVSSTGEHVYNHSSWLGHAFGGTLDIAEKIISTA